LSKCGLSKTQCLILGKNIFYLGMLENGIKWEVNGIGKTEPGNQDIKPIIWDKLTWSSKIFF